MNYSLERNRQFALEALEERCLLAGVTVLTHGFQLGGGTPDWLITMGQAILDRADGPRTDRTVGSIFHHEPANGTWQPLASDIWTNSNQPEDHVVLIYDWAEESSAFEDGWLEAAADNLFANLVRTNENLGGDLADVQFLDVACGGIADENCDALDFHFIGHSRGAVLNSLVTERFATYFDGLPIEHVTSLDPHPASAMNDPGYVANNSSENSRLFTYDNVLFADNYYRQDLFYELDLDFDGVFAEGAFNLQIPESVLSGAGSSTEHSDVHTWYYGTVTEPFDPSYTGYNGAGRNHDGDVSFPESWYGVPGVPDRAMAGFHFSQIGAGDRSALTVMGTPSIADGVASVFNGDFALGNNADDVPGWLFHGGEFQADYENGRLHLGGPEFLTATHNRLYVPDLAIELEFDYEVTAGSADDTLEVYVGELGQPLAVLSLMDTGVFTASIPLLAALPRTAAELSLRLNAGGVVDSDVLVDNVRFAAANGAAGDFDANGLYECDDVDALVAAIAHGPAEARFDLDADGLVDGADLLVWLQLGGAANLPSGNAYLLGDATLDGVVDGQDFLTWNDNKFTSVAAWCAGDFTADGVVDGLDFIAWNDNKFTSADRLRGLVMGDGMVGIAPTHHANARLVQADDDAIGRPEPTSSVVFRVNSGHWDTLVTGGLTGGLTEGSRSATIHAKETPELAKGGSHDRYLILPDFDDATPRAYKQRAAAKTPNGAGNPWAGSIAESVAFHRARPD